MNFKFKGVKPFVRALSLLTILTASGASAASQIVDEQAHQFANGELEPFRAIDSGQLPNSVHIVPLDLKSNSRLYLHSDSSHQMLDIRNESVQSTDATLCAQGCPTATSASVFLDEMLSQYETYPYYYGAIKGPSMVAKDKSGNPFELASLYAAVIANNALVHDWRYVFGRVQVSGEQLKKFVGVDNAMEAAHILHTSGYQVSGSVDSTGKLVIAQFNHVWLKVKETSSSAWVSVDPSFKAHTIPNKFNLNALAGVNPSSLLNGLSDSGALNNPNGIMIPDIQIAEEFSESSQDMIANYLSANRLLSYEDVVQQRKPVKDMYNGFGHALPYQQVGSASESQSFSTNHKHRIKVTVAGINHTVDLRDVIGSRLTLSYEGATTTDKNKITANGGVLGLLYKEVKLVPVLKSNGTVLARGSAASLGEYQQVTVTFFNGSKNDGSATHYITVGGIHAIALDPQHISDTYFEEQLAVLENASQLYRNDAMDERYSGQLMHILGLSYYKQLDNAINNVSSGSGAMIYHKVSEALMSIDLTAKRQPNGQYRMAVGSRGIDAPRNVYSIFSYKESERVDRAAVLFATGIAASGLEHAVFEKTLGWPSNSTMSILRFAAQHEVPIYVVKASNVDAALAEINMPANIETSMRNAVNSGRIVITPKEQMLIGEWNGVGYIVLDPNTGAAGYLINGGNAGGKQAFEPMDLQQTNDTWFTDVVNIGEAVLNGVLMGEFGTKTWDDPLLQSVNDGSAFVADLFFVGDVRNLGITTFDLVFNDGSFSDVALAGVGFIPLFDIGKAGYKVADSYFDVANLSQYKNAFEQVMPNADVTLAQLNKNSNISAAGLQTLHGGWNSVVTKASRNDMGFTNVALQDGHGFVKSLGLDPNNLTKANKGLVGESASEMYARSQGLSCVFCGGNPSANGLDNIFKDTNGNYIIDETKFVSGSGNAGLSGLSTSTGNRQLTNAYLFGNGTSVGGALGRTSGLSNVEKQKIFVAFQQGKVKTRYTVVKDRHVGAGVTQGLTTHPELGVGGSSQIDEIVIIELPIKN
ncbi:hypothetical protein [Pseudoalteromonas luteoviolacea]|uniref:Transglutaminase-like domain-containing protein n=1 Tax=Pseudoalteromonas luteoviolacea S4054 TaxID=1129367 RepID=A0A0F6A5V1_9GAMM|nr:hypothetical protein [Pseudoalteromonas luteoviolacea]AOT07558.1 hypothetical protein S4054249_06755 [Pseudoalteromonas luteoviolacea]AOT12474.1 hypothetical protein S40542_06755 [Pseudoalteromonas luteoviolacea]AOT17388.1 hypothetical protein S4054_06755 [Pseudoalteromonas luteoviolacea]KKE81231.1 hypothetical protein N479_23225 [Pseudoalteromonas luteoviolacea S4054]KZN78537.1 hypothetical protein N481_26030 [Pseudoalteromonas luteoviolacea S4047-1]